MQLLSRIFLGAALACAVGVAAAQGPRTMALGRYDCRDEITGPLRMMGYFTLHADGTYQYLDKPQGKGRYRYDPSTGAVQWLSGPYAKDAKTGDSFVTFYRLNSADRPMITMRLVGPDIKYADTDYCFLRSR